MFFQYRLGGAVWFEYFQTVLSHVSEHWLPKHVKIENHDRATYMLTLINISLGLHVARHISIYSCLYETVICTNELNVHLAKFIKIIKSHDNCHDSD